MSVLVDIDTSSINLAERTAKLAEFTVVVAEDDAVFRRVISFTLQRAGLNVLPVANGQLAWELLQTRDVDCLVTDHQMPQLSGTELIAKLRGDERFQSLPVVLCTAKGLELDAESLIRRFGITSVMHKPFSPRKLTNLLLDCCRPKLLAGAETLGEFRYT